MISVHYEDSDLLILNKPRGLPTAPLAKNLGPSLSSWAFDYCPSIALVNGRNSIEGGLLHRLDNDTEGLVLFAKNQEAYQFILNEALNDGFEKGYLAYCNQSTAQVAPMGYSLSKWQKKLEQPSYDEFYYLQNRFIKAASHSGKVKAVAIDTASKKATKIYNTSFTIKKESPLIKAKCLLTNGFRHQVRATLSALGLPIEGDPLYNDGFKGSFKFWATSLSFIHPATLQREIFEIYPKEP